MPRPPLDPGILLTVLLKEQGVFGVEVDAEREEGESVIRSVHLTVDARRWVRAESRIPKILYLEGAPLYQLGSCSLGERLQQYGGHREGGFEELLSSEGEPGRQSVFAVDYAGKAHRIIITEFFLPPSHIWLERLANHGQQP